MKTYAYLNWGRVVADCPRPHCASAAKLEPRQSIFHCVECKQIAEIEWPTDIDDIMAALEMRPVASTRNWFPAGHALAVRAGQPHGQTVADLHAETAEHMGGQ